MTRTGKLAAIIAMAAIVSARLGGIAYAHDSNTLHKIGKAIQYTTRKDVGNLSVDVHRAEGRKSVITKRRQEAKYVVKPNGHTVFKSYYGARARYAHHRYRRHAR